MCKNKETIMLINYKQLQRSYVIIEEKLEKMENQIKGYNNYISSLEKDNEMLSNKVKIYQEILDKIVKGGLSNGTK